MKNRYKILQLNSFRRDYKKFKRNQVIKLKIRKVVTLMQEDPFSHSLRTHQVDIPTLGLVYSSRVTGDLRLIWDFDENDSFVIIAIRIQGHDTVYS